ncbi:hypothetical protein F4780DRAFT_774397 [Xylariomycetidae sp. FL0641]|nr:hypothetical protein F4780DRAFT_774397 [Xylariomycetidae sp. FL0641]
MPMTFMCRPKPLGERDANNATDVSLYYGTPDDLRLEMTDDGGWKELPQPGRGKKRKPDAVDDSNGQENTAPEPDPADEPMYAPTATPQQIRRKLHDFVAGGNMKVGELQGALGVSASAYQNFVRQHGTYQGLRSATYARAACFFRQRERQGLKTKKPPAPNQGARKDGHIPAALDVEGGVRALLRRKDVTAAALCRVLSDQQPSGGQEDEKKKKKLVTRQLHAFLGKRGIMNGNTTPVFRAAYVLLEKLRVKHGRPKSEFRRKMEEAHGPGGVNTRDPENRFICKADDKIFRDEFGRVHIQRADGTLCF